jgi:hypothetical protein
MPVSTAFRALYLFVLYTCARNEGTVHIPRHVCLPVCPHVSSWESLNGFSWNLVRHMAWILCHWRLPQTNNFSKSIFFWNMTQCSALNGTRRFGGTYRLHLQGKMKPVPATIIAYFPWYDTGHIENDASKNSSIVTCEFVTTVTFLPIRCLATIRGFLPSRYLATIKGFLLSRCLATIERFLPSRCPATIGVLLPSRCLATIGDTQTHTRIATWSHKPALFLFQNKKIC